MTRNSSRLRGLLTLVLGLLLLGAGPRPARAQWGGMGMGMGWGLGFRQVPSPTDFINQHALTRAAQGMQMPQGHNPYAGNSNSYFNRVRDNGFVSHYDARRRRAPSYRTEASSTAGSSRQAEPRSARAARVPLGNFFNASRILVWPSESPIEGDLKEKRDVSDQSSLAVLDETLRQSIASVSSVTHARQKLLEYGQPALQDIREQATPVIADTFHRFMLSLYDALEQAAIPAEAASGAAPER
jgi:hypothetical protein